MKKIICILLCFACLLCTTACKKNNDNSTPTNSSTQSNTSTPSDNVDHYKDMMTTLFGFTTIQKVNYYCVKNTPDGDAIYAVSSVITDGGEKNDLELEITCNNSSISASNGVITIPRDYTRKHSSVTLTALHSNTSAKCDFTINFEKEWNTIFADDFNGTKLDEGVWNIWDEQRDWRYSYLKDNMFLDGKGNLVNRMEILEKSDTATGESKTSGAMTTMGTFETTYGYFEIRMIAHRSPGLMGAFWLMCGDMGDSDAANDSTAKNGCEVDIIETFYHNINPAHTIHWDGYTHTKSQSFSNLGREDIFDGNYHTFAFRWSPTEYAFLIDNVVTARCNTIDICTEPGYLLISSHFNNDAGEPSFGVGEHTDMVVDYVKVYKSPKDPV